MMVLVQNTSKNAGIMEHRMSASIPKDIGSYYNVICT